MKRILLLIVLMLFTLFLSPEVKNPDNPLKGEWHLNPEKVWTIGKAGNDVLAEPSFAVTDDGTCLIYDYKNGLSYTFDSMGNFKKAFGKRGEGPGEVKMHAVSYPIDNELVIVDQDKLHYFSKNGEFIKSVLNNSFANLPLIFINENEFISIPMRSTGKNIMKRQINYINLKSGEKKMIREYSFKELNLGNFGIRVIPGLTPQMVLGYDFDNNKLYYGMDDSYVINVSDLNGNIINTFSLERKKKKISEEAKKKWLELFQPELPHKRIMKILPNEVTYFRQLIINDGFVYVFNQDFGNYADILYIDIFSDQGKYLYRSTFKPTADSRIYYSAFNSMTLKKGHLYVVLEDNDGEVTIVKYKIALPKR
jgi:hypothetical protein